jgi:hypothetical protein
LLSIDNTIVSGNMASEGREIYQAVESSASQGYNLFGYGGSDGLFNTTAVATDIKPTTALREILMPLGDYGGSTKTHALVFGSPAIGAGDPGVTTPDQRGETRVGITDIGAFESKFIPTPPIPLPTPIPIEPTPQPIESIPIDRTRNLESPDPRKPLPSISNSKALLCVVRALNHNFQLNDPYKGIETCAFKTPEIEEIDRKTQPDR